jgi:hypothetical protein
VISSCEKENTVVENTSTATVDQLNAADKPRVVQIDEATLEQRQKDTAAWLADPQNQAEMEAGKAAVEAEIASRAKEP